MTEKKQRRNRDIVARFAAALAHASKLCSRLSSLPRRSFSYCELLDEALAPYRVALDEYAAFFAEVPGNADAAEADGAYERVMVALSDILETCGESSCAVARSTNPSG
jgi:hypothetical protein